MVVVFASRGVVMHVAGNPCANFRFPMLDLTRGSLTNNWEDSLPGFVRQGGTKMRVVWLAELGQVAKKLTTATANCPGRVWGP